MKLNGFIISKIISVLLQLAKLAGNKVVATCGGSEKASLLKKLGVDRIIDYKTEIVSKVYSSPFLPICFKLQEVSYIYVFISLLK